MLDGWTGGWIYVPSSGYTRSPQYGVSGLLCNLWCFRVVLSLGIIQENHRLKTPLQDLHLQEDHPALPFPPRCFHFHSVRHSFHYHPQARAYVTVTCSHRDRSSYIRCYFADTRLSLAATPSHLHLHLSRVQLWPSGGACVSVSGTRSISNTKGSELELGLPQRGSEGGDRVSEQRWWDFFIFFSSMSVCVYGYWLPFSRRYWPCHCRPPLILPIDLLRSSTPSIADPCVFVCVCVYVCVFAVNGLVLAIWSGLKCANADVNMPGCAQSLLFKPQNNPHQLNAVWMLSVTKCEKSRGHILCSPRAF